MSQHTTTLIGKSGLLTIPMLVIGLALCHLSCSCSGDKSTQNELPDELTGTESNPEIDWIEAPAGEFTYGSQEGDPCIGPIEELATPVRLTRSFLMATTEITQAQWEAPALSNPSRTIAMTYR